MPRGGKRTGAPGKSYSNRSDLNVPAMAATGQQYGAATAQMAAQRALPIARPATDNVPTAPPAAPAGAVGGSPAPAGPMPGGLGFADETARPNEPVTAGVPVGAGLGPEALAGPPGVDSDLRLRLGAMYQAFPTEDLRQLIEMLDDEA